MKLVALLTALLVGLVLTAAVAASGAGTAPAGGGAPRPAGTSLAFVRGTAAPSVWLARIDGSRARRLGLGETPLLAPDGDYVAASTVAGHGAALVLYGVGPGYRFTHAFFDVTRVTATPLAWSPDSRYLAVELLGTSVKPATGSGLAVIDTQTLRMTMLASGIVTGASFDPAGSDRLVYGLAPSLLTGARSDLHTIGADGAGPAQITRDGRSLYPVWARTGIIFDRERLRGKDNAPIYQVCILRGKTIRLVTHTKVPPLLDGLVALAVSADGNRVLAEYEGQDTSSAYTIQLKPLQIREVRSGRYPVQGAAISADGATLLISAGGFEEAPSHGQVERIPFAGGPAVKLTRGAQPSWNR